MSEIHLVYSWPFCLNAIIDYFVIIETEQIPVLNLFVHFGSTLFDHFN